MILALFAAPLGGQDAPFSPVLKALEQAMQSASKHPGAGPEKTTILLEIAACQARAGDAAAAEGTFQAILRATPGEGHRVAISLLRAGNLKGAVALAETLKEGWILERKDPLIGTAVSRPVSLRTDALEKMVDLLLDSKRWTEALDIVALLPETKREGHPDDLTSRQEALGKVAVAQAKAGEPALGLATARKVRPPYYRDQALREVVAALIHRAELKEAVQANEEIKYPHVQLETLVAIATAQADAGDRAGATATFRRASDLASGLIDFSRRPSSRVSALIRIAAAQALSGDRASALATMQKAADKVEDLDLPMIAVAKARLGALDEATAMAESIGESWRRISTLIQISGVLAQAGDSVKVAELCTKAAAAARSAPEEHLRTDFFLAIGKVQVEAGLLQNALQTAAEIGHRISERAELIHLVVRSQLKGGDLTGARKNADSIPVDWTKALALREVALVLLRKGDLPGALALTDPLHSNLREQTFLEICIHLADRGELESALRLTSRMEMMEPQGRALRRIAAVQAAAGDDVGALTWASSRKGALQRAYAFLGLAEGLLEARDKKR